MLNQHQTDQPTFRDIGRGTCGSVFEIPGTAYAIKKGANIAAISNDFNPTKIAYNAYLKSLHLLTQEFPTNRIPCTPVARYYNGPTSEWWTANLSRFPEADRNRAAAFHLTYILPVIETTRQALVSTFFQRRDATRRDVLGNPENRDCLIRLYLGKNNPNARAYDSTDTLRNFPLYLDDARVFNVNTNRYAEEMAIGLAILHWQAQIDAQDTEFVIGSSKTIPTFDTLQLNYTSSQPSTSTMEDLNQQESQSCMWMLDYDKCTEVDLKASQSEIIRKYLVAVTGNDPYYPHPRLDEKLWRRFRETYLRASQVIITSKGLKDKVGLLPGVLIKQWEQWGDGDFEGNDDDVFERDSSNNEEEEDVDDDIDEQESGSNEDNDEDDSEVDDDGIEEDSNGLSP